MPEVKLIPATKCTRELLMPQLLTNLLRMSKDSINGGSVREQEKGDLSEIQVIKFDGTRQLFDKEKIVNTCIRMGAEKEASELVAEKIKKRAYDGIPTKKILQMIFRYLKKYHPKLKHQIDLRKAISLLRSQPDFEQFVRLILQEQGYTVTSNQVIRGKCVEHEIDGVARKGDETLMVEIKHHYNHHTYTGLDPSRIAWATLEDLTEGYKLGLNSENFTGAMIVCNTKFSRHAKQYAECRGLLQIGWREPPEHCLERMIEEKKLYPITLLRGLNNKDRTSLLDEGIILLKHLVAHDVNTLSKRTNIPITKLHLLMKEGEEILSPN